jgi:hypothetical protein
MNIGSQGCSLYMGGKSTFVKLVLEAILVFWHSMAYIPKGVLEIIKFWSSRS